MNPISNYHESYRFQSPTRREGEEPHLVSTIPIEGEKCSQIFKRCVKEECFEARGCQCFWNIATVGSVAGTVGLAIYYTVEGNLVGTLYTLIFGSVVSLCTGWASCTCRCSDQAES